MVSWQNGKLTKCHDAKKNILSEKRDCVETFHHSLCIIYDGPYSKEQQDWSNQIGKPKQPKVQNRCLPEAPWRLA